MTTLATSVDPRRNSLNALRLLFATAVVVSHAPEVGGWHAPYQWGDLEIGGWAVAGFFAISGWLITGSRMRLEFWPFLWNRIVRIYPGYWVALAVTAFVLAPISLAFDHGSSLHPVSAVTYLLKNATLEQVQHKIQHTLVTAPFPTTWNLSLWTLVWEFACYVGVGVLLSVGYARRNRWVTLAVFLMMNAGLAWTELAHPHGVPGFVSIGFRLGTFFLAGAVLKQYAESIPSVWWLAVAAVVVLGGLWDTHHVKAFAALPIAYLTMYLGGRLPLQSVGRRNDISYGVYIYAFPLQQVLAMAGANKWGITPYTVLCVIAVVPFAVGSWFLVEKPAMRLKNLARRGRGRHVGTPTDGPDAVTPTDAPADTVVFPKIVTAGER